MPKKKIIRKAIPMAERKLRSGFERKIRKHLESKDVEYEYESMVIRYVVPETKRAYKPDFILANGIIVESKGRWESADRLKMVLVIEQHPELDIRMLFQRDNFLNKKSKTKYSQWCKERGIKFAVSKDGFIPDAWLK